MYQKSLYIEEINVSIDISCSQASYQETNTILCLCTRCKEEKQLDAKMVTKDLYIVGFKGNYYIWLTHREHYYEAWKSLKKKSFYR